MCAFGVDVCQCCSWGRPIVTRKQNHRAGVGLVCQESLSSPSHCPLGGFPLVLTVSVKCGALRRHLLKRHSCTFGTLSHFSPTVYSYHVFLLRIPVESPSFTKKLCPLLKGAEPPGPWGGVCRASWVLAGDKNVVVKEAQKRPWLLRLQKEIPPPRGQGKARTGGRGSRRPAFPGPCRQDPWSWTRSLGKWTQRDEGMHSRVSE